MVFKQKQIWNNVHGTKDPLHPFMAKVMKNYHFFLTLPLVKLGCIWQKLITKLTIQIQTLKHHKRVDCDYFCSLFTSVNGPISSVIWILFCQNFDSVYKLTKWKSKFYGHTNHERKEGVFWEKIHNWPKLNMTVSRL